MIPTFTLKKTLFFSICCVLSTFSFAQTLTEPSQINIHYPPTCGQYSLSTFCQTGTVVWYNRATGGFPILIGSPLTVTPTGPIIYYAACETEEGEKSSRVASGQIDKLVTPDNPTSVTVSKNYVCQNEEVILSASCIVGIPKWYTRPEGPSGYSPIGTGNSFTYRSFVTASIYATCLNGNCESIGTTPFIHFINEKPAAPTIVLVDKTLIGVGDSVSLTATCTSASIVWYEQATGGDAIGTGTNFSVTPDESTTYYAACKDGNCEGNRTPTDAIVFISAPVSATVIDSSSSVNLSATCILGTVTWYNQASGGTAIGTGSPLSVTPASTTTYYAACESDTIVSNRVATAEVKVKIHLAYPQSIVVSSTDICIGDSVSLSASCAEGTVTWYDQPVFKSIIGTGSPVSVTLISTAKYYVSCERGVDSSGRVPTDEIMVKITPDPTDVSVDKINICTGDSITLAAICSSGSVRWYTNLSGSTSIGSGSPLIQTPVSNLTYYAACISDGCLSNKVNTVRVIINAIPDSPTDVSVDKITILNGRAVTLNATCTTGVVLWYNQATRGTPLGEASAFKYYPSNITTFYTGCRNGACESNRVATSAVTVSAINQLPYIVKNINTKANDSNPYDLIKLNNNLYFFANDGENGTELWESNGSAGGTKMVKNINPNGLSYPEGMIVVNNILYFIANDDTHGAELWRSDGTTPGTEMVKDINPNGETQIRNLTDINGTLYFNASDGTTTAGLWKIDKITGEAVKVTEKVSNVNTFVNANGIFLFQTYSAGVGELWKSDGTDDGTIRLLRANNWSGSEFLNINGTIYFSGGDYTTGIELWKTDGTADGTELVMNIAPGYESSDPNSLTDLNGTLYFIADDGTHGNELWKSDGTPGGTIAVKDSNDNSVNLLVIIY